MITLVVKVTGDAHGGLHGTISRVASGETRPFVGSAHLVSLIEEWTACDGIWPLGVAPAPSSPSAPARAKAGEHSDTPGLSNT